MKKLYIALCIISLKIIHAQDLIITDKPWQVSDTSIKTSSSLHEIDATSGFAYGVVRLKNANFWDIVLKPKNISNIFFYHNDYNGKALSTIINNGAYNQNCWFGIISAKLKIELSQVSKNQDWPIELTAYAVNYSADGIGPTYLFFDLLPDINANSSFPDALIFSDLYQSNALKLISFCKEEKTKQTKTQLSLKLLNISENEDAEDESTFLKYNLNINNLNAAILEKRYLSESKRHKQHYIYQQVNKVYCQTIVDEQTIGINKQEAINQFKNNNPTCEIKHISSIKKETKIDPNTKEVKRINYDFNISYTKNGKCYFGYLILHKLNNGAGLFSELLFSNMEELGELNCDLLKN
jgi:hypothetical protein